MHPYHMHERRDAHQRLTETIFVRVRPQTRAQLEKQAANEQRPMSDVARELIERGLTALGDGGAGRIARGGH